MAARKMGCRVNSLIFVKHPENQIDGLAKIRRSREGVIPAEAGIQLFQDVLDPGFRRGDGLRPSSPNNSLF